MVPMATPPDDEEVRVRVAGLLRRGVATAIDALVVAPFALAAGALVAVAGGLALPRAGELGLAYAVNLALAGGAIGPAILALAALVVALYFFVFHALRGQTPGGLVLKLRVIDAWGLAPSPLRALARTLAGLLSLVAFGLGFLWIGFDREKRGLHDWLAGTWVVLARPLPADGVPPAEIDAPPTVRERTVPSSPL
jgi:uncharacterized RDD family membrane protein YckC